MPKKQSEIHWISTTKAAGLLGVSRVTVFKRIKERKLKAEKVGRNYIISTDEIDRFLGKQRPLSEEEKKHIAEAMKRAVKQYGTALRMLGKE